MSANRFEHPGLIFPDVSRDKLNTRPRRRQRVISHDLSVDWGLTTEQIMRQLGLTSSAVRQYMHRHKVPFRYISNPLAGSPLLLWERSKALELIDSYPPRRDSVPPGYVTMRQAKSILNVANTTFYRLVQAYSVPSMFINCVVDGQRRLHRVYDRQGILDVHMMRAIGYKGEGV